MSISDFFSDGLMALRRARARRFIEASAKRHADHFVFGCSAVALRAG